MAVYVIFVKSQRVDCTEHSRDFKEFVANIKKYARCGYKLRHASIEEVQ